MSTALEKGRPRVSSRALRVKCCQDLKPEKTSDIILLRHQRTTASLPTERQSYEFCRLNKTVTDRLNVHPIVDFRDSGDHIKISK